MSSRTNNEENIHSNLSRGVRGESPAATKNTPRRAAKTPATKSKPNFTNAVAAYHLAGVPNTPWSKTKPLKGNEKSRAEPKSIGEREILNQNPEDTMNLGGGTASLAYIHGDLNASVLSTVSGASSAASSDVMNQTTLSDTHELSTSNFIMSAVSRGIMRNGGLSEAKRQIAEMAQVTGGGEKEGDNDLIAMGQEPSMTLPDMTLGDLSQLMALQQQPQGGEEKQDEIDFTSQQRKTPNKGDLSTSEDSTASSIGLNAILVDLDTQKSVNMEGDSEEAETGDLSLGSSSIKSIDQNGEQQSFVESTASQNDLDGILNDDATARDESKETVGAGTADKLASVNQSTSATPQPNSNISSLRQSPSFLSGKKQAMPWRKSIGGEDLAKIRALTASLKKSNRDRRTSLPAASKPAGKSAERENDSAKTLFSETQKSLEKEKVHSPKPPKSPSRKSKRDSPARSAADSPARNTRSTKKSPARYSDDDLMEFTSHQRNTPGKKRKEVAMLDDSAADSSLGLDGLLANISVAENSGMEETGDVSLGLGSPKSPKPSKSPSRKSPAAAPLDSPARNTRSAKKSKSNTSPARSLFNSPPSPSAFNQLDSPAVQKVRSPVATKTGEGPFSGRKRNSSPASDARKPLKKRLSLEDSTFEHSDDLSLSKEFPFLSQNTADQSPINKLPVEKAAELPDATTTTECGTETIQFNQLMNELPNKSTVSEDSNATMSSTGLSFSEDESFSSSKQVRNKRRETADLNDLALILGKKPADATGVEENVTPPPLNLQTPREGSVLKTPKSILNSSNKKSKVRSNKKLVMFGSPETAMYNIGSPSASFTPMQPKASRGNASETDCVEQTTELEGDITQMIAKASDPSLMGHIDESRIEADFPSDASSTGRLETSCQLANFEKTVELETNIYSLVNNSGEESEFSLPSVSEDSTSTPSNVKLAGGPTEKSVDSSMDIEETVNLSALVNGHCASVIGDATQTVALEGNMTRLLDVAANDSISSGAPKDNSQTIEIEDNLASLLDKVNTSSMKHATRTIEIEGTVASLLDKLFG